MTLFGLELPLHLLLLAKDDLMGDIAGEGLSTSSNNFPVETCKASLGTIFNSAGVGNGDFSDLFSPKYGQVHGGGSGYEELSAGWSDLLLVSSSTVWSVTNLTSWKLEPRLLQRGEGFSSLDSPSWNVDARRRLVCHGEDPMLSREDCEPAKLSTLLSSELKQKQLLIKHCDSVPAFIVIWKIDCNKCCRNFVWVSSRWRYNGRWKVY